MTDIAEQQTTAPIGPVQEKSEDDPLVKTWFDRIRASEKHWGSFHKRVKHNRELVQGIDKEAEPTSPQYNKQRANLIAPTISVVLSKVYAKNPEMSGQPINKARDLALFCETVSTVTQVMLEDAKLKQKAKRTVKAAMTCSFGIVKVQYQKDIRTDPVIKQRIEDSQDNVRNIESLLAQIEGDNASRCDLEGKKRELEQAISSLEASKEVVAAEGLVIDTVRTERLLIDPAIEDIWDYEQSPWLIEKIPMRKSVAMGTFKDIDLDKATTYGIGKADENKGPYSLKEPKSNSDDPLLMVYEVWRKTDNTIYTLVDGIQTQFAREPYQPEYSGERWWPYFLLPFQSVDGCFVAQSLVDVLEKLQEEHNETRDKFATVRKNIRPHYTVSADVTEKSIKKMVHPDIGEYVVVDTGGVPMAQAVSVSQPLPIDPAVYDTSPIRNDWEMVSGLQDAARSVVVSPKTATEANISDQSLAARVSEFRDQVEDWLTEIAQYASELCLLAMSPAQVEQIMGMPEMSESGEMPEKSYEWPQQATPDTVFNLIQMKIRSGSTAAPNKLQAQENWTKALPLFQQMVMQIRQIDAMGGDSTPERELLEETASRFDETIDVDRFVPRRPQPQLLTQIPGMPAGMPMPGGLPGQTPLQ